MESMTTAFPKLQQIDSSLHKLLGKVELLLYINPINTEKAKQQFFKSKFIEPPQFRYPKCPINSRRIRKELFKLKIQKIEEQGIADFYEEVRWYFNGILDCLENVGKTPLFLRSSLKAFGAPTKQELEWATTIVKAAPNFSDQTPSVKNFSAEEAVHFMKEFVSNYGFEVTVKAVTHMSSKAMVSNSKKAVLIKKGERFSAQELKALAHHEIGVHLVTAFNAEKQPLKVFSLGFPFNVQTQEGLAVLSEYYCGALDYDRLFELALRVITAEYVVKGVPFVEAFDTLTRTYGLSKDRAFNMVTRLYRGGGFTKDRLYLPGFVALYQQRNRLDKDLLFAGKTSSEYTEFVVSLKANNLFSPLEYKSHSFSRQEAVDQRLESLIELLK